jgi:protein dithiol:quinone oxidoreductase
MSEGLMRHAPRLLVVTGLLSLLSLAAALVAQHGFDMRPCPWCVLQRLIVMLIAAVALLGGLAAWALKHHSHPHRGHLMARLVAIPVVVLALGGLVAATYQHEVASQNESCSKTFADTVLTVLDLEARWPSLFMVTASCNEAARYRLLGLPFEIWSGLLFALVLGASLVALLRGSRP